MATTKLDFLTTLDMASEPTEGSWQSVLEPSDVANLGSAPTLAENRAPNIFGAMEIPFTPPFDTQLCNPFIFLFVDDPDAGDEITLKVSLDAAFKGVLRNFTVGSYDEATGVYTFKGTASEAGEALRSLRFDPRDRNGVGGIETTKITVTVTDSAGLQAERSGEIRVQTTSNQLPTLTLSTEILVVADTGIISPFAGVSIADPENDDLTVTIWFPPAAGVLFREEADGSRTEISTLTGKAVEIQAALRALKFDPTDRGGVGEYADSLSFSIGVHDGTRRIGKDLTIYVTTEGGTASAAPDLTLPAVKELTVLDTQTIRPFANIDITDDSTFVTVTITFDPAKGRLLEDTSLDPIIHNGVFMITNTPENVLRVLQGLRFDPRDRAGDPDGSLETTTFTITVQDGEHKVENSEMKVHSERGGVLPPPGNSAPTDVNISSLKVAELSAENTLVGS